MPLNRLMAAMLSIGLCAACGARPHRSSPADEHNLCRDYELDVEHVWGSETKRDVDAAFRRLRVSYAEQTREAVITRMDDLTRDWVMLKQSLCLDCKVRQVINEQLYAARSACFDEFLMAQRPIVNLLRTVNEESAARAVTLIEGAREDLRACQKDAIAQAFLVEQSVDGVDPAEAGKLRERISRATVLLEMGKYAQALELADDCVLSAARMHSERLEVPALLTAGEARAKLAQYAQAQEQLERVMALASATGDDVSLARALMVRGGVRETLADFDGALDDLNRARLLYQEQIGTDHGDYPELLTHLALTLGQMGRYDDALHTVQEAMALVDRMDEPDFQRASLLVVDARIHFGRAEYETSLVELDEAKSLFEKLYGSEHPGVAECLNDTAHTLYYMGQFEQALALHEESLAIDQKVFPADHPQMATHYNNLGIVLADLYRYDEAITYHEKARALYRKAYGENHPEMAISFHNTGIIHHYREDYVAAIADIRRGYDIYLAVFGEGHPELATFANSLGQALYYSGDLEAALVEFDKALAIFRRTVGERDAAVGICCNYICQIRREQGQCAEAVPFCEKAISILTTTGEEGDYNVTFAREALEECRTSPDPSGAQPMTVAP